MRLYFSELLAANIKLAASRQVFIFVHNVFTHAIELVCFLQKCRVTHNLLMILDSFLGYVCADCIIAHYLLMAFNFQ